MVVSAIKQDGYVIRYLITEEPRGKQKNVTSSKLTGKLLQSSTSLN